MTKRLFPFLLTSLACNAAFALVFALGSRAPAPEAAAPASAVPAQPVPPVLEAGIWSSLQTTDLPTLVARLRATGVPPDIIRAMVAAQIAESFAARRKALEPADDRLPFWKPRKSDPKTDLALRQIYREQEKALRDVLGEDTDATTRFYLMQQGGKVDFLPKAKGDEIVRLLQEYNERRSDLYTSRGTVDQDTYAALEKAQHDAIARTLTPQELLEYDLRNSGTARNLRNSLAAFSPSEEEFRAIFQLQQSFEDRFGTYGSITLGREQMRERDDASKQLTTQIKALLAPDRAAEYDRAIDYSFRQTSQLVTRLDLPPETTVNLWNIQKEIGQRAREIAQNTPDDQRTPQLVALQQEALAKVAPLLGGANRIDAYKLYGGAWINTLVPRAPTLPPPKN